MQKMSQVLQIGFQVFCALLVVLAVQALPASSAERVLLEVAADTPTIESGKAATVLVRALVRPPVVTVRERTPLAVAIVLDKSGSMGADRKMENARLGALEALERLDARDVATVIVYDSEARVLVPPRSAGDKAAFRRAIMGVREGGSTALYDGVKLGAEKLRPFVSEGFVPRIVMLSDGQANVGPSSTRDLAELGRRLSRAEVTITTIGLGLDYNEDLMTVLASESGGNSYFAKDADALTSIFARDMDDAVTLTARKVCLTIEGVSGAMPLRAIGREGERRGNVVSTSIDNLYGAEKYALFEVEIPGDADASILEAAVVRLEYVDPATGETFTDSLPLRLAQTEDASEVERNRNGEIIAQAALARNAEVREEVVRLADEGRVQEAARVLKQREADIRALPAPAMSSAAGAAAVAEAEYFEELANDIAASGSMSSEQRKKNVNDAYVEKNQQSKVDKEK